MSSSADENGSKKITLLSSDGEVFEVDESVALESQTIKHMIEHFEELKAFDVDKVIDCADNVIPLPNVTSKILRKVIDYCEFRVYAAPNAEDMRASAVSAVMLKSSDDKFVKVDQATLFDLILAANYLAIEPLLDLACQAVADMIKGKTPEEIRKTFNINNEEEEEAGEKTSGLLNESLIWCKKKFD